MKVRQSSSVTTSPPGVANAELLRESSGSFARDRSRSRERGGKEDEIFHISPATAAVLDENQRAIGASAVTGPSVHLERQYLAALTLAGLAATLMSTIFDLFHLETFLDAYGLPLGSYARGNIIYTAVSAVNDICGAWLVDSLDLRSSGRQGRAVALSGFVLAASFILPFFRWGRGSRFSSRTVDATHFALTMSAYDSAFTFCMILFGSMFTDCHHLNEITRVRFMASGKIVCMAASLAVARVGLSAFDTTDLSTFRFFVVALSLITCGLFALAQNTMPRRGLLIGGVRNRDMDSPRKFKPKKRLDVRSVLRDFASHANFRAWILAEMLLEAQASFSASFLKEFVDRLLRSNGVSNDSCDWLLSSIRPLTQIAGIALYVPIRRRGYRRVYMLAFEAKFVLSLMMVTFSSAQSTTAVALFLTVDSVLTSAVQSSGFHLAMADMVAELKLDQLKGGRYDEPSLAGLLMGANAMLCKPMGAFLPILAAWSLAQAGYSADVASNAAAVQNGDTVAEEAVAGTEHRVQAALFYLLVGPSLIFSIVQILAWSKFDLDGKRAEEVRIELNLLQEKYDHEDELVP